MGVQIKAQLGDDEFQRLQFRRGAVGGDSGVCLDMEGKVQAGEQGPIGQSIHLRIFFAALLLEGHIGHGEGRTGRKGPACVVTRAGHSALIVLQVSFLLGRDLTVPVEPFYVPGLLAVKHDTGQPSQQLRHAGAGAWSTNALRGSAWAYEQDDCLAVRTSHLAAQKEGGLPRRKNSAIILARFLAC